MRAIPTDLYRYKINFLQLNSHYESIEMERTEAHALTIKACSGINHSHPCDWIHLSFFIKMSIKNGACFCVNKMIFGLLWLEQCPKKSSPSIRVKHEFKSTLWFAHIVANSRFFCRYQLIYSCHNLIYTVGFHIVSKSKIQKSIMLMATKINGFFV